MIDVAGVSEFALDLIRSGEGPLPYLAVFVGAAIPWIEILLVIPAGVLYGLNPALVAVLAFGGNVVTVYAVIVGADRLANFVRRWRRGDEENEQNTGRRRRAERLWNRYGLPGLALASPVATGVHLAVLLAFGFGANRRSTTVWMTASLALWTVIVTALSVAGLDLLLA